ncbi:MAG: VCBS repeat-containing protein [Kouleothrix sp.]|nr:VCBS repeat-containing protein [Kouleothrix sp.]
MISGRSRLRRRIHPRLALLLAGMFALALPGAARPAATLAACDAGPRFSTTPSFPAGQHPHFIAAGDLNGDSRPDLVAVNDFNAQVGVLLNTTAPGAGAPSFAARAPFGTGASPHAVALADLDGDGKLDLISANGDASTLSVLRNTTAPGAGAPSFAAKIDIPAGSAPAALVAADFNADGRPDLAVASARVSGSVGVLLNTTPPGAGAPSFAALVAFSVGSSPVSIAAADVNGDGKTDLATANYSSADASVLLNTTPAGAASPTFGGAASLPAGSGPQDVAAGDLDGDGKPDLAITNQIGGSISVLRNTTAAGAGAASFAGQIVLAVGGGVQGATIGDLDGDGKPDLIVANQIDDNVGVLRNTSAPGAPGFAGLTSFAAGDGPWSVVARDLNADGKIDLAAADTDGNSVSVLLNITAPGAPSPALATLATFATGTNPIGVAAGDLNQDGRTDLAVANNTASSVSVLLNTTPSGASGPTFAGQVSVPTDLGPYEVALGDLNADGKIDMAVANNAAGSVNLILNTTAPGAAIASFTSQLTIDLTLASSSVALGDFNADGKPDLAVANAGTSNVSVLLNSSTPAKLAFGSQVTFMVGFGPSSVVVGDFNGDGKPDLATANTHEADLSVLLNTTAPGATTPSFNPQVTFAAGQSPYMLVANDLNADGRPDLAVANYFSDNVSVLLNTATPGAGAPSFAAKVDFAAGDGAQALATSDLNGDGKPDLIAANYLADTASVLMSTTSAGASVPTFAAKVDFAAGLGPQGIAAADINGDGRAELATTDGRSSSVSVLLNLGLQAALTIAGGTPQQARAGHPFAAPLQVALADGCGAPIAGSAIVFHAPASGASATLSSARAVTSAAGQASVTATANNMTGSYQVTAAPFGSIKSSIFSLSNILESYMSLVRR